MHGAWRIAHFFLPPLGFFSSLAGDGFAASAGAFFSSGFSTFSPFLMLSFFAIWFRVVLRGSGGGVRRGVGQTWRGMRRACSKGL